MKRVMPLEKIKLAGFNNLTKAISFNLYDFCTAANDFEREAFVKMVNEKYNAAKITHVLKGICNIIEANVLSVSDQDYDPWGASSMVLMSDLKGGGIGLQQNDMAFTTPTASASMHLDKSHICAHTYPDFLHQGEVCSIRVDIDIATCGEISPLNALNYMFQQFTADVVVIDYVVRGFTRDADGRRVYMDHELLSIQEYINDEILADYYSLDLALQRDLIWQTKMLRTRLDEQSYFLEPVDLKNPEIRRRLDAVKQEMRGVLHMFPEN